MSPALFLTTLIASLAPIEDALENPREALRALRKVYATSHDAERRQRSLEIIARLPAESVDGAAVTRALARGLFDASPLVRARSAELLRGAPDAGIAVRELARAVPAQLREEEAYEAKVWQHAKDITLPPPSRWIPLEVYLDATYMKREQNARLADAMRELDVWMAVRRELAQTFATIPDSRSVYSLGLLLQARPVGVDADASIDALLQLGTRDALRHVIRVIQSLERELAGRERAVKALLLRRPGANPYREVDDVIWAEWEWRRLDLTIDRDHNDALALVRWGEKLQDRLLTFANAHDLAPVPANIMPSASWRRWADSTVAALPASFTPDE